MSKSTLKTHQTKAKYCLQIQGKDIKGGFTCQFCDKDFTLKSSRKDHELICVGNTPYIQKITNDSKEKDKLLIILTEKNIALEQRVKSLEKDKEILQVTYSELAKISAKRSTTTNHNTVNNLNLSVFNKTQEDIKRIVDEKYNKEYLLQGQKGVARFTHSHVLDSKLNNPPMYLITDKARCNGKYRVSDKEIVTDNGMDGLTKKVHPSIRKKAIHIVACEADPFKDEELYKGYQEVFSMDDDGTIFKREMMRVLDC
jgi:hypothetical protein